MDAIFVKNFCQTIVSEVEQFINEYNFKLKSLNSVLDENNLTIEAKKMGRELFQSHIDFLNKKLIAFRERIIDVELKELMSSDSSLSHTVKVFENGILEQLDKSYVEMITFIRTYELDLIKTHRNDIFNTSVDILKRETRLLSEFSNKQQIVTNKINSDSLTNNFSSEIKIIFETHIISMEGVLEDFRSKVKNNCFSNKFTEEEKQYFTKIETSICDNIISSYKILLNNFSFLK